MDYAESLEWLYALPRYAERREVERVRELLDALGNPQRAFTPVNVTGTNGKGSTCAALSALLQAAGKRTGLYTSPHLVRFNERIRVDGVEVGDADVARHATAVRDAVERTGLAPAGFDAMTALAFLHFAESGVDVAVLEAGIGGRLDATNAFEPPHAAPVVVLTNVDLEHTEVLGDSKVAIAREKLALAKRGATLVAAEDDAGVLSEVDAAARERDLAVVRVGVDARVQERGGDLTGVTLDYAGTRWKLDGLHFPLAGAHQVTNAACALAAAEALESKGVASWTDAQVRDGLAATRWPGRLDVIARDPLTVVDAAHNPHGVRALVDAVRPLTMGVPTTLVLGVSESKPYRDMVAMLLPLADRLVLTCPKRHGLATDDLLKVVGKLTPRVRDEPLTEIDLEEDVAAAVELGRMLTPRGGVVLVAGGLFLAAEAIRAYRGAEGSV